MSPHETPRIYLVQPQYGPPCEQSTLARFSGIDRDVPHEDPDFVRLVGHQVVSTSLLPQAFNELLCKALDSRDRGEATHFAMLHADVWPEPFWITDLWRLMRTHEADVVSVVIPIKRPGWLETSTAIGYRSDPWRVRHITHRDRDRYPLTFGAADVCTTDDELLLVNTGCWLADLRHPAWDAFTDTGGFGFETRITRNPDGTRKPEIQPEDWRMSRVLTDHGAKLLATWEVHVQHGGFGWWANYPE